MPSRSENAARHLFRQSRVAFGELAGDFFGPILIRAQGGLTTRIVEDIEGLLKLFASSDHVLPGLVGRRFRKRGQCDISLTKILACLSSPEIAWLVFSNFLEEGNCFATFFERGINLAQSGLHSRHATVTSGDQESRD